MATKKTPLLNEYPKIEVGDQAYQMRPLGYRDIFTLGDIIKKLVMAGRLDVAQLGSDLLRKPEQAVGALIFMGLSHLRDDVSAFLSSVLQVSTKTFEDPTKFPLGVLPKVIRALITHVDFASFLSATRELLADKEAMTMIGSAFSSGPSMPYNQDMVGETSN